MERFGLTGRRFGVDNLPRLGDSAGLSRTGDGTRDELAELDSSLSDAKTERRRLPSLFLPKRSRRSLKVRISKRPITSFLPFLLISCIQFFGVSTVLLLFLEKLFGFILVSRLMLTILQNYNWCWHFNFGRCKKVRRYCLFHSLTYNDRFAKIQITFIYLVLLIRKFSVNCNKVTEIK